MNHDVRSQARRPGLPVVAHKSDEPTPKGGGDSEPGKGGDGRTASTPRQPRGLLFVIILMVGSLLLVMFLNSSGGGEKITWAQFETHYQNDEIDPASILLTTSRVRATLDQGVNAEPDQTPGFAPGSNRAATKTVFVEFNPANAEVISRQLHDLTGGLYEARPQSALVQFLWVMAPLVIIMLIIWFLISRSLRNAGGGGGMLGNFGKSKHRMLNKEMTGVTFKDVAGIDEAKDEVAEIIEFLRNPKRFTRLGGRIPRGVLLIGDPGCGKTLLAKAIAGEADVPFFSISGSDFVEMFVGVGASRVRDLFKQAKENSPCIIFLDEIDAVGRRRGGGFSSGGHDEREQTLNAILVEMDGFAASDGVIVIAATNRGDVLDPALIRPGRFDRQITVPLPDVKGRLEVLKVHSQKVKLGPDVDLERLAKMTPMFSGADLAAIINEAAITATMSNKDFIEQEDLEEARDKVKFGRAKKSRVREKDENKLVAFHEAGHAVLQALLRDADPLHKVTIIPRGGAGGATFSLPEKDRMGYGLKWLGATMRVLCGGRIAEERAMQDVSSGASQDIAQTTSLARTMVLEWGMSPKLGFVRYSAMDSRDMYLPDKDYSESTAQVIDEEIRRIVDEAYADANAMLDEHWDQVEAVAEALLRYETLSADEVHKVMRGEELGRPTIADLIKQNRRPPGSTPAAGGEPDGQADGSADGVVPSPA